MMITNQDKFICALRELGYRKRVYKRRVANGSMSEQLAQREIDLMTAIVQDYHVLIEQKELPFDGAA